MYGFPYIENGLFLFSGHPCTGDPRKEVNPLSASTSPLPYTGNKSCIVNTILTAMPKHSVYNKLWKLLIDRKMSKADLRKAAGLAPNTMTRLRRDQEVTMAVLYKICTAIDANIGDVLDFLPDSDENSEPKDTAANKT